MEACVVLRDQKCSQTKKIMLKKKKGHGYKKCVVEHESKFQEYKNCLKAKQPENNCDKLENSYNVDKSKNVTKII